MLVIKIKLNQIVKMGYKSTYKSEQIQTRLEQGYYDDIVEAGIQGGVFNADTQPTKGELDLKLAQSASGGLLSYLPYRCRTGTWKTHTTT